MSAPAAGPVPALPPALRCAALALHPAQHLCIAGAPAALCRMTTRLKMDVYVTHAAAAAGLYLSLGIEVIPYSSECPAMLALERIEVARGPRWENVSSVSGTGVDTYVSEDLQVRPLTIWLRICYDRSWAGTRIQCICTPPSTYLPPRLEDRRRVGEGEAPPARGGR